MQSREVQTRPGGQPASWEAKQIQTPTPLERPCLKTAQSDKVLDPEFGTKRMKKPRKAWTVKSACECIRYCTPDFLKLFAFKFGDFMAAGVVGKKQRFPDMCNTLKMLKDHGFDPKYGVDIGAYKGEWTLMFKEIFPSSNILMVEPQQDKEPILRSLCDLFPDQVFFQSALLGAEAHQEAVFYSMETGSSILPELSDAPRKELHLKTMTLDLLLANKGITSVDFLKLDTQGYELEILKGAPRAFGQAQAILTEVQLIPYNKGAPLIAEVTSFF